MDRKFDDEDVKQPSVVVATKTPPQMPSKPVEVTKNDAASVAASATIAGTKEMPTSAQAGLVDKSAQTKSTGWIYRGQFHVTNAEMVSPKIKDKIKDMGGQKAGEVEIGWQKTPNIYYFHFTVPEAILVSVDAPSA